MYFVKGQKVKLGEDGKHTIKFKIEEINKESLDLCYVGTDSTHKLKSESHFVFYNNLKGSDFCIHKDEKYATFLSTGLNDTDKSYLYLTASETETVSAKIPVFMDNEELGTIELDNLSLSGEKSYLIAEFYKKNGEPRMNIALNPFNGGIKEILDIYMAEVNSDTTSQVQQVDPLQQQIVQQKPLDLTKKEKVEKLVLEKAPRLLNLTKKATVVLEKKKLDTEKASVVVVLDRSGSMFWQYKNGDLQKAIDKLLPISLMLDDDGTLDCWAFGDSSIHLPGVTLDNIDNYLVNERWKDWNIGRNNNEPDVLDKVISTYKESKQPVYVIFISDGGIYKTGAIKKLIKESAYFPIFWQFVGIGGNNYGVLENLDDLKGRIVDNADFFSIDRIDSLSDEDLYNRLLNEYPSWLKEVREKNILRYI